MPSIAPAKLKEPSHADWVAFQDDLVNLVTGLGTSRDRATQSYAEKVNYWDPMEAEAFYQSSLARKSVDIPVDDMMRHPRVFGEADVEDKQAERLQKRLDELKVDAHVTEGLKWAAVYGGCGIIPKYRGVTDAMMEQPLNLNRRRPGTLESFITIDARNIYPVGPTIQNPLEADYLRPKFYRLAGTTAMIHQSWIIFPRGLSLPRQDRIRNNWWDGARLKVFRDDIVRALMVRGAMSQLLDETNLDIFSIEGLNAAISGGAEAGLQARVSALATFKSLFKVVLKDSTEKFERAQISVSGFSETLAMFYGIVAAMADIPVSRFMGTSAKGLNATGEGDMRNYYDGLATRQRIEVRPIYDQIDAIVKHDIGMDPKMKLDYEFPSLWQEPPGEKADRELKNAQRDQIYIQAGVITAEIVAKNLRQEGVYTSITEEHIQRIAEMEEELDDAEHEALKAGFENAASGNMDPNGTPGGSTKSTEGAGTYGVKPALKTKFNPDGKKKDGGQQ